MAAGHVLTEGDESAPEWRQALLLAQSVAAGVALVLALFVATRLGGWSARWLLPALGALAGWQVVGALAQGAAEYHRRRVEDNLQEILQLVRLLFGRGLARSLETAAELAPGPVADTIRTATRHADSGVPWLTAMEKRLSKLPPRWIEDFLDALRAEATSSALSAELFADIEQRMLEERKDRALARVQTAEAKGSALVAACTALVVVLIFVAAAVMQVLRTFGR